MEKACILWASLVAQGLSSSSKVGDRITFQPRVEKLPTEIGQIAGEADFLGKIRYLFLDMFDLKCLLEMLLHIGVTSRK